MQEREYAIDILKALAEQTIKKLWIIIILLIVLLFGSNAAWIVREAQYQEISVEQDVEQDAYGSGDNTFVGGDYHGTATSKNDDTF